MSDIIELDPVKSWDKYLREASTRMKVLGRM